MKKIVLIMLVLLAITLQACSGLGTILERNDDLTQSEASIAFYCVEEFYNLVTQGRGSFVSHQAEYSSHNSQTEIELRLFIRLGEMFSISGDEFEVSSVIPHSMFTILYVLVNGTHIEITYDPNRYLVEQRYYDHFTSIRVDDVNVRVTMPPVPSHGGVLSDETIERWNLTLEEIVEWRDANRNEYLAARAHRDAIFANPAFAPITDLFSDSDRVRMHAEQQLADNVRSNVIFFD